MTSRGSVLSQLSASSVALPCKFVSLVWKDRDLLTTGRCVRPTHSPRGTRKPGEAEKRSEDDDNVEPPLRDGGNGQDSAQELPLHTLPPPPAAPHGPLRRRRRLRPARTRVLPGTAPLLPRGGGQALPPGHASGGRVAGLRAPRPVHREGDRRGPGDGPDVDPRRERPSPEPAQRGDGPRQPGLLGGVPRPVGGDRPQGRNEQQVQRRRLRRRGVRPGGLRVGSPGSVPVRRGWTGEDAARGDQAREAVDGGGRGVRGAGVREQGGRGGRNAHVLQAASLEYLFLHNAIFQLLRV
ncbi:hypothetical protein THAOC_35374 [Thalassiosira oceanica]|uniref:Uncharacterized protein n=1 Tax=Thalassiosira oceanica TaxID=159749 RepID=K0RAC0_THAOC|nr:hypothetical protein THAOC_35374 [Thalassiosira oceanica]|eukprot:EJK45986.1 hypothetical protein THAOC_35374 [Thalassiosira oceanica]